MKYAGRVLAGLYAAIVLLAVLYALTTEIYLQHQQVEHLLPPFVLALVTLPLSLAGESLYSVAPSFFGAPFVSTSVLHVVRCCAGVNSLVVRECTRAALGSICSEEIQGSRPLSIGCLPRTSVSG
jgi:hypothetical protein